MLKKAQGVSVGVPVELIVVIIAIAAVAIVIIVVVLPEVWKLSERDICRNSVILRSKKVMGVESGWMSLNCPTNFIDIKKDGIYQDGDIDVRFNRGEKSSEKKEKIKRYIAEQMYDCWYQFNKGQSDPWGDWGLRTTTHCMICADINFDESFNDDVFGEGKTGEIEDFGEYLNTEKVPGASKEKYSEYFGGRLEIEEDISIDTSQPYLVLYKLDDVGLVNRMWEKTFGGCGDNVLLGLLGPIGTVASAAAKTRCVVGFGGDIYTSTHDSNELQAKLLFVPADVIKPGYCHRIG